MALCGNEIQLGDCARRFAMIRFLRRELRNKPQKSVEEQSANDESAASLPINLSDTWRRK